MRIPSFFLTTLSLALTFSWQYASLGQTEQEVSAASDEAERAIARFQYPERLRVELFAAEPMIANPVAFCVDEHNRFYVAETFRHFAGVTDNRRHMYWLDDELAARTVQDRVAMFKKHLGDKFADYKVAEDRVRRIVDTDGDGKADTVTIFADGFNDYADGIGAGVLARQGTVWYTCIPHLWMFRDQNADGVADSKESLHEGYGVHVAFLGHDLHGLIMGTDGRLYFSIGDRGANIKTETTHLFYPDTGVVFRCNPDGSELEAFAYGLRNPQELAFDEFGNLFTCDNNSDSGDLARVVHVLEGGDSGWRMNYQYITSPVSRGPWNAEKLWHPHHEGQPAYIVPPLANLSDGPSGFVYDPGVTLLPPEYRRHFFLADFRGDAGQSGIRSFAMRPKGASFEVVDQQKFIWSILATDVDFGTDGAMYLLDWVQGWDKPAKGRLYKFFDPQRREDPVVAEVAQLLSEGMVERTPEELYRLLGHPDVRIRKEAQFSLAQRGNPGRVALVRAAKSHTERLGRLHGIWGLGQIARVDISALDPCLDLLNDEDEQVRAQMAKVLGDTAYTRGLQLARQSEPNASPVHESNPVDEKLVELLSDSSPAVRYFAAMTLGKRRYLPAGPALLRLAEDTGSSDPALRHACVMALTWIADPQLLNEAANAASSDTRMAGLLAYRRLRDPKIARFLADPDPRLVDEAARAIHDEPIGEAMDDLANLIERPNMPSSLARRVLNANFRLGTASHAKAVAQLVLRDVDTDLKVEALEALAEWSEPSGRDRITFFWRPLPKREPSIARQAATEVLPQALQADARVRQAAASLAGTLNIEELRPELKQLVNDANQPAAVKVEALRALEKLQDPQINDVVRQALSSKEEKLRSAALELLARLDPQAAVPLLQEVLNDGSTNEKQNALATLGQIDSDNARSLLQQWLTRLLEGNVPPAVQLELLTAARKQSDDNIRSLLAEYKDRLASDPIGSHLASLEGGDAERGRKVFFEKTDVSCVRCHRIDGRGGEVGPDLSKIAAEKSRRYLLESIVTPDKEIAKGFETLVLALTDGSIQTGVLKEETETYLRMITPKNVFVNIPKDDIELRQTGKSAMPTDLIQHLSPFELRDLIEYLSHRK